MAEYKEKMRIAILLFFVALGVYLVYQVYKPQYTYMDMELYIYDISENEIIVKNFPQNSGPFAGSYRIEIDDELEIKDEEGNEVKVSSLKQGDFLLFDYKGEKNPKPEDGTVLNSFPYNIYNIRLSDKEVNYKFWGIEFP